MATRSEGRQRKSQHCLFALFRRDKVFTSEIVHHERAEGVEREKRRTYTNDGRIIRHSRWLVLLRGRAFFNPQVLDIGATEHDVLVELDRRGDLLVGVALAALSPVRPHIFEGNGRVLRVDAVQSTDIARRCIVS